MTNCPPYNIEKLVEDQRRITMAVAGFLPGEIELVQDENTLFVNGQKHPEPEDVQVLHCGIATRAFKQTLRFRVRPSSMEGLMNDRMIGIGHNRPPAPCIVRGQPWPEDAQAVIFRRAPPVTTSGKAGAGQWILRFERRLPQVVEPLMGWTADDDTLTQVELRFTSQEEAVAYAERQGLAYRVRGSRLRPLVRSVSTAARERCGMTRRSSG